MSDILTVEWNVKLKQDTPDHVLKTLADWHEYPQHQTEWLSRGIDIAAAFGCYYMPGINSVAPNTAFDRDALTIKTVANFTARNKGVKRIEQLVLWLGPWVENADQVIAIVRSESNMYEVEDGSGIYPQPPSHGFTEVRFKEGNPHLTFTSGDLYVLHPWVQ